MSETIAGDVSFDAVDRLAVMNLVGAYCHAYDAGDADVLLSLFTDKADFKYVFMDKTLVNSTVAFAHGMQERLQGFAASKTVRHHVTGSFLITSQSAKQAEGRVYVQVLSIVDARLASIDVTATYDFTAIKQDNVWKFSRFLCRRDQPLE
jgi:SnoaL-like domain